jgi:hypothetical protein
LELTHFNPECRPNSELGPHTQPATAKFDNLTYKRQAETSTFAPYASK